MERFSKRAPRDAEEAGIAIDGTSRPEIVGSTLDVRYAEEIPAQPKIQSEIRPHFPIVLEEPVEFVLVDLADLSSRVFRLARMVVRCFIVGKLCVGRLPGLKSLVDCCHRSGQKQQQVLSQRDVAIQEA